VNGARGSPSAASFLFRGQAVHALFLTVLLPVAWGLAAPALGDGHWLGLADTTWFWIAVGEPVVHQLYVWIAWRAQLRWETFSGLFRRADFAVYGVVFYVLLALRPVLIAGISAADSGSLALSRGVASGLAVFVLLPSLYTAWSVQRYFGLARAAGGDHFRRRYREMPLVTRGAFAWTPNAMYTFGFLGLWTIALFARSHAGLVAALFQHAYIWVHYVCTEQPDMARLYGEPATPRG